MSNNHSFRVLVAVVLLTLVACGSKSPSSQEPEPSVVPETETAASAALAATQDSAAESLHTRPAPGEPAPVRRTETLPDVIRKTFPSASSVRSEASPFPHRVILDSAVRVLGYEVFSDSAGVTAQGYAGMVPVQVFFDARGKPVRIYILENCETPAYMDVISGSGLFERLLAFDPGKPDSVDAVTLATSSSRAVIAGVTGLAARVLSELAVKPDRGPR